MPTDILRLIDERVTRSRIMREASLHAGREEAAPPGPTIVISRQLGSGGKLVAERVAERLGFDLWDKNLVDAIASDAFVTRRLVESFDEKTVSEIDLLARTFAGQPEAGGFLYRRHLAHTLLAIAKAGNAVIVGRGANFILTDALSVRVIATDQYRESKLMEFEGLSRDDARRCIHDSDRERAAFIRQVYDRNVADPLDYDVVAVVDCFGIDGVTDIVIAALKARQDACWRKARTK